MTKKCRFCLYIAVKVDDNPMRWCACHGIWVDPDETCEEFERRDD